MVPVPTAVKHLTGGSTLAATGIVANSRAKAAASPYHVPGGHLRIAFQGEPGAYSEKACRELLGDKITTMGKVKQTPRFSHRTHVYTPYRPSEFRFIGLIRSTHTRRCCHHHRRRR